MTLKELYDDLGAYLAQRPDAADSVVGVETQNGGIPARHKTKVKSATLGFDWERGWLILTTEEPLCCVRVLAEPAHKIAKAYLEELKQYHARVHPDGKYIAKAREREWCEGFAKGIEHHITSAQEGTLVSVDVAMRCPEIAHMIEHVDGISGDTLRCDFEDDLAPFAKYLKPQDE
jgi:hypothetical protein